MNNKDDILNVQIQELRKQIVSNKFVIEDYLRDNQLLEDNEGSNAGVLTIKRSIAEIIVSELRKENMVKPSVVLNFSQDPTVDNLIDCFSVGVDIENNGALIISQGEGNTFLSPILSTEQVDGHHPLIIKSGEDVLSGTNQQLATQGGLLLASFEKRDKKNIKLDPSVLIQLRSELSKINIYNGSTESITSSDLLDSLNLCITTYEKYVMNAFFQKDISSLKKIIGKNRGTKSLNLAQKTLLDSVFRRIETWYDKEIMMYDKASNIDRTESGLLLGLYKPLGNEGDLLTKFLPALQDFFQARQELLRYRLSLSDTFDKFISYISLDVGNKDFYFLRELFFDIQKSLTNEQLSLLIPKLVTCKKDSEECARFVSGFGPLSSEIITIIGDLRLLAEKCQNKNNCLETYINNNRDDLTILTKKITISGSGLGTDIAAFFKTLGTMLEPQTSIYYYFKKTTYPHNIPVTLNNIRNMIGTTGRTNLPSGVMPLTGKPTAKIQPIPSEEKQIEGSNEGKPKLELKENRDSNGPFIKYRGLLDAYVGTAERLADETRYEVSLFKKCVGISKEKIGNQENDYLYKLMENKYKKYFQTLADGKGIIIPFKGVSDYSLNQNIKDIAINTLLGDFFQICLGSNGLLERIFDGYNSTKLSINDNSVIEKKDAIQGSVFEAIRATERFTKIIYDLLKMYTGEYRQWLQGKISKYELLASVKNKTLEHQNNVIRMHMNAIESSLPSENIKKEDNSKVHMQQILQGYVTIYALIATVSEIHKSMLGKGMEEKDIVETIRNEHGKESIHAPLLLLQSMIYRIYGYQKKKVSGTFLYILGSDNIFSLIALLYQDIRIIKEDNSGRRHLLSMLDVWYNRLENNALKGDKEHTPLLLEQMRTLDDIFGETVTCDIYKLLALYFIDSGAGIIDLDDITHNLQDEDEGYQFYSKGISSEQLYIMADSLEDKSEENLENTVEILKGKLNDDPWFVFQQYILPIANDNALLTELFKGLYEYGEVERLLETCLAYSLDDISPDYPDDIEDLRYKICAFFENSGILQKKLTIRKIAKTILGSLSETAELSGLSSGAKEIAGEEDIEALENLFDGDLFVDLFDDGAGIESIAKKDMQQEELRKDQGEEDEEFEEDKYKEEDDDEDEEEDEDDNDNDND